MKWSSAKAEASTADELFVEIQQHGEVGWELVNVVKGFKWVAFFKAPVAVAQAIGYHLPSGEENG